MKEKERKEGEAVPSHASGGVMLSAHAVTGPMYHGDWLLPVNETSASLGWTASPLFFDASRGLPEAGASVEPEPNRSVEVAE